MRTLAVSERTVIVHPFNSSVGGEEGAVGDFWVLLTWCFIWHGLLKPTQSASDQIQKRKLHFANALIVNLFAADQQQSWAAARVGVRGGHAWAPAHLLRSAQRVTPLLVELKTFLAAAIVYPAVKRHVAIIRLCGFIDGKLGLLGSVEGELRVNDGQEDVESGVSPRSRHAVKWGYIHHSTVEHPCEMLVYFDL